MRSLICLLGLLALAGDVRGEEEPFRNEPAARKLYDTMLQALAEARTLSYESAYRWEAKGDELGRCTYRAWLEKPNRFRLETRTRTGKAAGTLVGDGEHLWIFWPGDRPFFSSEERADWEKTKRHVYIREPTPPGRHSIAHKTGILGAGMSMAILNPSRFHGAPSSLDPYLDGVRGLGVEQVGEETCDVIEVSYMSHQRSIYLWLARRDHLPRRLKQVVRVSYDIISHETWTDVRIDEKIEDARFQWQPPAGWRSWRLPRASERLLKGGSKAPDFHLVMRDGTKARLSDYRGKVIWLCFWRVG